MLVPLIGSAFRDNRIADRARNSAVSLPPSVTIALAVHERSGGSVASGQRLLSTAVGFSTCLGIDLSLVCPDRLEKREFLTRISHVDLRVLKARTTMLLSSPFCRWKLRPRRKGKRNAQRSAAFLAACQDDDDGDEKSKGMHSHTQDKLVRSLTMMDNFQFHQHLKDFFAVVDRFT